jgi:hypothetical protein
VLLTKYYSVDQIKKNERSWAWVTMGDRIVTYRILVGRLEGKRSLGRHWPRWKDNIKNGSSRSGVEV